MAGSLRLWLCPGLGAAGRGVGVRAHPGEGTESSGLGASKAWGHLGGWRAARAAQAGTRRGLGRAMVCVCACVCVRVCKGGGGGEAPQAGPWPPLPAQMGLTAPGVGAEVVWGPAHKPTALLAPGPGARHTLSHGGCRGPSSGRRNAGSHRPQICRPRPRRLLPETPTPLRDREPDPA